MRIFQTSTRLWALVAIATAVPAVVEPARAEIAPAAQTLREGERRLQARGAERDPAAACELFEQVSREPLPRAWWRMGQCHERGWGRPVDKAQAADWFGRAAKAGFAPAQTAFGLALQRGDGVERDATAAVAWFGRAALAGDSNAALALARAYEGGVGAERDPIRAAQWMQHAADRRNPAAQLALAQWYLAGQAVERSPLHAYAWAQIAAESALRVGDAALADLLSQRAAAVRRHAAGMLSGEQLIDGQRMSREWRPQALALQLPGGADRAAPDLRNPAHPVPPAAAATTTTPPPAAAAPRPRPTTGSGFFVSRHGHLVTNEHVVRGCREIRLGDGQSAELIAIDRRADLALLKAGPVEYAATLRVDARARQGEDVLIYGFPLRGVLSSSGQLGAGMVTALSGLRDNPLQIQIDVPVQPGNSGGPLIDAHGEVIGVVVSKLNALKIAQVTGDIPQNVNFAVAAAPLKALVEEHSVPLAGASRPAAPLARESIAEAARRFTTAIVCAR